MQEIFLYLQENLNSTHGNTLQKIAKEYAVGIDILESINRNLLTPIEMARLKYIYNLSVKTPMYFDIPIQINAIERSLMFLSFRDYDMARSSLRIKMNCEIVGSEARTRTGMKIFVPVVKTENTENIQKKQYCYENLVFDDFGVEDLTYKELLFLYILLLETYEKNENENLKKDHVLALSNRILYSIKSKDFINEKHKCLEEAVLILRSEQTGECEELKKYKDFLISINEEVFQNVLVFKGEFLIAMGRLFERKKCYGEALEYYGNYPLYYERIECLIQKRRFNEAIELIGRYLGYLAPFAERSEKILGADLYCKLATISESPEYFVKAAEIFPSGKPWRLMGIYYHTRKMNNEAVNAFEKALDITPSDTEALLIYGSSLAELERYRDALRAFKRLKRENPTDEFLIKNISYCYYKMKDVEKSLETLRLAAMQDHRTMKEYIYVSLKHGFMENVFWGLEKIRPDRIIKDLVNYLVIERNIRCEEISRSLERNPNFSSVEINDIIGKNL